MPSCCFSFLQLQSNVFEKVLQTTRHMLLWFFWRMLSWISMFSIVVDGSQCPLFVKKKFHDFSSLCRVGWLKFMGKKHQARQLLPFISSRKPKSLEVQFSFFHYQFQIVVVWTWFVRSSLKRKTITLWFMVIKSLVSWYTIMLAQLIMLWMLRKCHISWGLPQTIAYDSL